jgi:hypothetical protein
MNRCTLATTSALFVAWAIAWPSETLAGTTGVVSGDVYNVSYNETGRDDKPISGAAVRITLLRDRYESGWWNLDTRTHETAVRITNKNGAFVYLSLEPGYYVIQVVDRGKYPECSRRVRVDVDQTTYVNLYANDLPFLMHCASGDFQPVSEPFSPP